MGRAIVRDPKVFLFDEPLSNLDAKLRVAMRAEIKALHQRLKTTTVYVTHDQIEAMTMADRIAVMNDGRIEQIGTPLELYDRPANLFVAQFIGSPAMNVFDGTLRARTARSLGRGRRRHALAAAATRAGQRRPGGALRHPARATWRSPAARARIPAEVIVVEPTGAETELLLEVGKSADRCRARTAAPRAEPGATIPARRRSKAAVHLFDPTNGAALRLRQDRLPLRP